MVTTGTSIEKLKYRGRRSVWGCHCRPEKWEDDYIYDWSEGNPDPCFVKIMLEYSSCELWNSAGEGSSANSLPLPRDLMDDLFRWCTDYEDIGDFFGSVDYLYECNPAFPVEWFNRRGEALAQRLRDHLPNNWRVVHHPLRRDYSL
jgi:hypothetical protein